MSVYTRNRQKVQYIPDSEYEEKMNHTEDKWVKMRDRS